MKKCFSRPELSLVTGGSAAAAILGGLGEFSLIPGVHKVALAGV
jgi:hypothetical protein